MNPLYITVRMEDDLLTAVTGLEYPVVAPLPSISNRLSVADFQRISPTRVGYNNTNLPEVAITEPTLSPERFGFWSPASQVEYLYKGQRPGGTLNKEQPSYC